MSNLSGRFVSAWGLRRRRPPAALGILLATLATGCGGADPNGADPPRGARPAAPGALPVSVEAGPKTRYYAKCHISTFKFTSAKNAFGTVEGFANTYVIDTSGPFADRIPSTNAQCVIAKISGDGDVVLHLRKDGDHSVRTSGALKWVRLNVW